MAKRTKKLNVAGVPRRQRKPSKPKHIFTELWHKLSPRKRKVLKWTGIVFGVLFLLLLTSMIVLAFKLPNPNRIMERNMELATQILDRNGELLYSIHGDENRTLIQIDDIPDNVKNATLAVEDPKFYKHIGFSVRGIIRATWANITKGKGSQGGSTITQQFVKNSILTPEKTFTRKFKELVLSFELELIFTKDQILQMYFNEIPYGSTAYGIKAASEMFLGKDLKDLTLAESAYLAGLPQAPSRYSPFINPDYGKARQEYVLDRMVEEGFIASEEAEKAKAEKIAFKQQITNIKAPHFVFYVKQILEEQYGTKEVEQGGLKVTTALDLNLQKIAEEEVAAQAEPNKSYGFYNAAMSAMDPKTGEVLAMVGSIDYFAGKQDDGKLDGQVNVMTNYRQPGSSFKPVEYAKAFEKGYPSSTIVFDIATDFGPAGDGKNFKPSNYSGGFSGPVSMRKALAQSLNIPAIKTFYLANPKDVATLANGLGYMNYEKGADYGLSTAIGSREVRGIDHLGAFATFANEGEKVGPTTILKIEDSNGNVLYENEPEEEQVLDQEAARELTNVLSDNNARSWGRTELVLPDRPVAAKTGTSNEEIAPGQILPDNTWTIGYTPSLAAVAWAGNNDDSPGGGNATGLSNASPIWQNFMRRATEGTPVEEFTAPKPIETTKPILQGKIGEEKKVAICKPSELLATDNCPKSMREEKTFREVHSILFYVNRDDPNGPAPENPKSDPQFEYWEGAVRTWAEGQDYEENPPTETDPDHEPNQWPSISITSPSDGGEVTGGSISITVNTSSPRSIKKVEYFLDNTLIGTRSSGSFGGNLSLPTGTKGGFHYLKAIIYDDVDNSAETEITVNVKASSIPPSVSIINPAGGGKFAVGDFPLGVSVSTSSESGITKVTFYYKKSTGSYAVLGTSTSPSSQNIYSTSLSYPGAGLYLLYAIAEDNKGLTTQSSTITITAN